MSRVGFDQNCGFRHLFLSPTASQHLSIADIMPGATLQLRSGSHTLALRHLSGSLRTFASTSRACQVTVASVPERSVIEVKGRDTAKLLQGLVSNNVSRLESGETSLLYASFLNPQGRMLADVFLHRRDDHDGWLMDVDSRVVPSLLSFIRRFKLRSKVTITDVSDAWAVHQAWGEDAVPADLKANLDPRAPGMGWRAVTPASHTVVAKSGDEYLVHRILHGVGEGASDFAEGASVPLENNVDYMNGVDFRKGCYVGQELTARTHHKGVVRKRIVPFTLYALGSAPPTSLQVDADLSFALPDPLTEVRSKPIGEDARGRAAGKFGSAIQNVGLGCLRLEQVLRCGKDLEMSVQSPDGSTIMVKPWIPDWWPEPPVSSSEE